MTETRDRHFDTGHLSRNLGRRAIRGGAVMFAAMAIRMLIDGGRIVVLARLLEPADYGLVAMVTAITGLIAIFQDLGLDVATVTQEKVTHAQVSSLFWINVAIGVVLAAVTVALAPVLAWLYGDARLIPLTAVIAVTFLFAGLTVQHQALLRRQMQFYTLSSIGVISATCALAVGTAFALNGFGYWSLVAMTISTAAVNAAAVWIKSGWIPGLPTRGSGVREMVRFGRQLTGANLVSQFATRLDHILMGWWWGPAMLGLYSKASSLIDIPIRRGMAPINSLVMTTLSRVAPEPARYRTAYLRVLEKFALGVMPFCAFGIGCGGWLVPFLLGPRWTDAAPMFQALAVVGLLLPLNASNQWLLVTQQRGQELIPWSVAGALMAAVAAVIGLRWGGVGVAVALAVSSLIQTPLLTLYVTRRGPVRTRDIFETVAPVVAASGCVLVSLLALAPLLRALPDPTVLALNLGVTIVVYLGTLCILPSGRTVLWDVWTTLRLLRMQRTASS
jgi:PST family polysaccharide transporter